MNADRSATAPTERGWLEWMTRRNALAHAVAERARRGDEEALIARGAAAVRAADRLLDPPDGSAPQPALSLSLYREACRWLLAAARVPPAQQDLSALLARAADALPERGIAPPAPAVRDALSCDAAAFADLGDGEQLARVRAVQRWLGGLLEHLELAACEVLRLRFQRNVRIGAVLLAAVALVLAVVLGVRAALRGPDLAAGKPWRASSTLAHCQPWQRWCGDTRTAIFFHTKEDERPWLEIDLGSVQRISRVEVENRSDFGPERAVPLRIEVSRDGREYVPVATRTQVFDEWHATFPPRSARYVRLTVLRKSYFHLERVSVRP